ncbi:hypothetical protein BH09MYX1_BH09MYX1_22510 [soil metagenome]
MGRRGFVLGATLAACTRRESSVALPPDVAPPPSTPPLTPTVSSARGTTEVLQWSTEGASTESAIIIPKWDNAGARYPLLIALHGRGEAVKPPKAGALGWANDYGMLHAIERLCAPPLTDTDYQGLSDPERLASVNRELSVRPFRGVVIACPHVPDLDLNGTKDAEKFAEFLINVLLPRLRRELPISPAPESTGIDGVSLGGALALRIGLAHPETFGVVGALQPAIGDERLSELTELAIAARAKRRAMPLRLTTSHDDYYKPWVVKLSDRWKNAGISHDFADVPGPHDYVFNRGPGVYEMLFWQDRALA